MKNKTNINRIPWVLGNPWKFLIFQSCPEKTQNVIFWLETCSIKSRRNSYFLHNSFSDEECFKITKRYNIIIYTRCWAILPKKLYNCCKNLYISFLSSSCVVHNVVNLIFFASVPCSVVNWCKLLTVLLFQMLMSVQMAMIVMSLHSVSIQRDPITVLVWMVTPEMEHSVKVSISSLRN